jgi:hypothetical protein
MSNSTTPKPPQIGGANYNPYRELPPGNMPMVNGPKLGKDPSPLATYEQTQQRIFQSYKSNNMSTVRQSGTNSGGNKGPGKGMKVNARYA